MTDWQPTKTDDLLEAIREFEECLPDWWWSLGTCHVSRDASCGPDRTGKDAWMLDIGTNDGCFPFDEGFHCDDPCGTLASSLRNVMRQGLEARKIVTDD